MSQLITIKQASRWATTLLKKQVTTSNISYLIQYGRIKKYSDNGSTLVDITDLEEYYKSYYQIKENSWKDRLGGDLNWALSFSEYSESETTKHVHRLHPYKGKFIPQLAEYFLDSHTDDFKQEIYFKEGDIVLDPFCGSGTALVQANELGMHAIGIDISTFNTLISNVKIGKHYIPDITKTIQNITDKLKKFQQNRHNVEFEESLLCELKKFNTEHFPSPAFKIKVRQNQINEKEYTKEKEKLFLGTYFVTTHPHHRKIHY